MLVVFFPPAYSFPQIFPLPFGEGLGEGAPTLSHACASNRMSHTASLSPVCANIGLRVVEIEQAPVAEIAPKK